MIRKMIRSTNRPMCNLGRFPSACVSALAGLFIGDTMKEIPLTQGKFALVDDVDYEWLNQWKWYAHKGGNTFYALRKAYHNDLRVTIRMHREILGLGRGDPREGDHCNHNGLHNWQDNLRICTRSQNQHNGSPRKNCSSSFKGVNWHKDTHKWQVQITNNGKQKYLGCFTSEVEAAKAYDRKAMELFGEFAHINLKENDNDTT